MRANCATLLSAVILGASFSCSGNSETGSSDASSAGDVSTSGTADGSSTMKADGGDAAGPMHDASTGEYDASAGEGSSGREDAAVGDGALIYDANAGEGSSGGQDAAGADGGLRGAGVSIFNGKNLDGWLSIDGSGRPAPSAFSVNVADNAIASTGGIRASLYYQTKYSFYRIIYTMRQVIRVGHDPGVLVFGTDVTADALEAVMFALPDNWGWDYRGGGSKNLMTGNSTVVTFPGPQVSPSELTEWATCEVLVNSATGTAKAACGPVGTKAVEVVSFQDPTIPNVPSYFAILCHTGGEDDEYKDITLEVNPAVDALITTQ